MAGCIAHRRTRRSCDLSTWKLKSCPSLTGYVRHVPAAMTVPSKNTDLERVFAETLNRHGYSFQYSVLFHVSKLSTQALWSPWVSELPVGDQEDNTRIDFILRDRTGHRYLVCECKRSDPALSNWCFARGSFQAHSELKGRLYMQTLERDPHSENTIAVGIRDICDSTNLFDIALEVKSNEKGDGPGKQIENAATQVSRGLNGLIDFFYERNMLKLEDVTLSFVPVVFTTARLWVSSVDLGAADLESGRIKHTDVPLEEKGWIWYLYPQGSGIKHSVPQRIRKNDIGEILFREFVKPIAIVNPQGINDFLSLNIWMH